MESFTIKESLFTFSIYILFCSSKFESNWEASTGVENCPIDKATNLQLKSRVFLNYS